MTTHNDTGAGNREQSALLTQAIILAAELHIGQTDKTGKPYILHPLRVMLAQPDDTSRIVAVLHDVVEDANIAHGDILALFGEEVHAAVFALTRQAGEAYPEFISRANGNEIARKVKIADIRDNLRPGAPHLRERYEQALLQLGAEPHAHNDTRTESGLIRELRSAFADGADDVHIFWAGKCRMHVTEADLAALTAERDRLRKTIERVEAPAQRVVKVYGKMEDGDGNPCPDIAALKAALLPAAPEPAVGAKTCTDAECDEAYEIGKRDGYSEAVQEIDQLTGGDGEYRYCLGAENSVRHTPGPAEMIQRIVDRFEVLNLLNEATASGADEPDDEAAPEPAADQVSQFLTRLDNAASKSMASFFETLTDEGRTKLLAALVPSGWKLVPVEPTEEMIDAGRKARMNIEGGYGGPGPWEAMLAAAPTPEGK